MEREDEMVLRDLKKMMDAKKNRVRIIVTFILLILAFASGFYCSWRVFADKEEEKEKEVIVVSTDADKVIEEEEHRISIKNVEDVLESASELVTTKYYYKDADTYENYKEAFGKKIPFTTDKVVFTYEGTIGIGIRLSEVTYEIDNDDKSITIILPEIGILSNEVDHSSFEYHDVSNSIFNNTVMEDHTNLIAELKTDKEEEINANAELLKAAEDNVKSVLKNFLTSSDVTKDYAVIFK